MNASTPLDRSPSDGNAPGHADLPSWIGSNRSSALVVMSCSSDYLNERIQLARSVEQAPVSRTSLRFSATHEND